MNELKKTINERVAEMLSLPADMGGVSTVVKIIGAEEITVDGYRGIIEYTENIVRLNTAKFIIQINGNRLVLKEAAAEFITVTGTINSVEYIL